MGLSSVDCKMVLYYPVNLMEVKINNLLLLYFQYLHISNISFSCQLDIAGKGEPRNVGLGCMRKVDEQSRYIDRWMDR